MSKKSNPIGRPPKKIGENWESIAFRAPEGLVEAVDRKCAEMMIGSRSEFLRRVIAEAIGYEHVIEEAPSS